jgi:hypothetical protein
MHLRGIDKHHAEGFGKNQANCNQITGTFNRFQDIATLNTSDPAGRA